MEGNKSAEDKEKVPGRKLSVPPARSIGKPYDATDSGVPLMALHATIQDIREPQRNRRQLSDYAYQGATLVAALLLILTATI